MTKVIDVPNGAAFESYHDEYTEFLTDVIAGLNKPCKQIQSKYFYDEHGSELFNQITRHPDYYLTRCETEILNTHKRKILSLLDGGPYNLVELGPGEGVKTSILIEEFIREKLKFRYLPIDISKKYLYAIMDSFKQHFLHFNMTPIHADYFRGLEWLRSNSRDKNLVLFLGSSIGNFDSAGTEEFLRHLCDSLNAGDYVLMGFDLRKNVDLLMQAYNDKDGITRDFNLNLLKRMNRELGANFNIDKFNHYATYNVYTGAMESYLISLEQQEVTVGEPDKSFIFESIEPIHVECSHKYRQEQIDELARQCGFEVVENFMDSKEYFVDALWRVKHIT